MDLERSSLEESISSSLDKKCELWHKELLAEFASNIRENINIRLDAVETIVNLGFPDSFQRFQIQRNLRNEIMEKIEPEIDEKTKVQHKACSKPINDIKDYRNVARNRLNRNKPKFLGNFVFGEIIFNKLYPFIYNQCKLNKLSNIMIMKYFLTILIAIFENHAIFTQTKPQPIITYNTLVNENLFKSGCINLLKLYQISPTLYQTEKKKKRTSKTAQSTIKKGGGKRDKAKMAYLKIVNAIKLINNDQMLKSRDIPHCIITSYDTRSNNTYDRIPITPPPQSEEKSFIYYNNNNNHNGNNGRDTETTSLSSSSPSLLNNGQIIHIPGNQTNICNVNDMNGEYLEANGQIIVTSSQQQQHPFMNDNNIQQQNFVQTVMPIPMMDNMTNYVLSNDNNNNNNNNNNYNGASIVNDMNNNTLPPPRISYQPCSTQYNNEFYHMSQQQPQSQHINSNNVRINAVNRNNMIINNNNNNINNHYQQPIVVQPPSNPLMNNHINNMNLNGNHTMNNNGFIQRNCGYGASRGRDVSNNVSSTRYSPFQQQATYQTNGTTLNNHQFQTRESSVICQPQYIVNNMNNMNNMNNTINNDMLSVTDTNNYHQIDFRFNNNNDNNNSVYYNPNY